MYFLDSVWYNVRVHGQTGKKMTYHKHGQTRQVIQWAYVTDNLGEAVLMPMPVAVFHVVCELLATRGLWPSTFAVDTPTNQGYNSPDLSSEAWLQWQDEVSTFISDGIEFMSKFDQFIKSQLRIEAALTGVTVDLDDIEGLFAGEFTPDGLQPTIELTNTALGTLDTTVSGTMATQEATFEDILAQVELIRTALDTIAGTSPEDLADNLEGIASTISTIATILGVVA